MFCEIESAIFQVQTSLCTVSPKINKYNHKWWHFRQLMRFVVVVAVIVWRYFALKHSSDEKWSNFTLKLNEKKMRFFSIRIPWNCSQASVSWYSIYFGLSHRIRRGVVHQNSEEEYNFFVRNYSAFQLFSSRSNWLISNLHRDWTEKYHFHWTCHFFHLLNSVCCVFSLH